MLYNYSIFKTLHSQLLGLLLMTWVLTSCNVTKYLDDAKGERLLIKNTLDIKSVEKMGFSEKASLQYELGGQYKQIPNRRTWPFKLFQRRVWLYHQFDHKKDSSKIARFIIKKIAEPPVIYDDAKAQRTAKNFQNQMIQRGYFDATCTYSTKYVKDHFAKVKYNLVIGRKYAVQNVVYESSDKRALSIIQENSGGSAVKRGSDLSALNFETEKTRITKLMRDKGFASFGPNHIECTGDTVGTNTNVTIEILLPADSLPHRIFTLRNITVFEGVVPDLSTMRQDKHVDSLYFATDRTEFSIKPERLYQEITIRPGQVYSQSDFDKTSRNLNSLGVFRFVAIRPALVQDSLSKDRLDVNIFLTPNDRLSIGEDLVLNSSQSNNAVSRNLLGILASVTLTDRNVFHGAERIQTDLQYNVEFNVASRDRFIFSQEFKFQNQMVLPRFFDYFSFWRTAHKLKLGRTQLVSDKFYGLLKTDGESRISGNYNYLNLNAFYNYHLINASFGYELRHNEHQYSFSHLGIDVLRPEFAGSFTPTQFLKNSFSNQLFTGFVLRSISYRLATKQNRFGEKWTFLFNSDLSGLEVHALNKAWGAAFGKETWKIGDLNFAKYLRLDLDATYSREFREDLIGALRMATGVVAPFGDSRTVPYVKQFFVGGPAGIRAWRIREIGPGGFFDPTVSQPYFETGDFRLEMNAELRFPLFWWLKGAIFLDAGNVWLLKPDPERPLGNLTWNSYKNMAIGTGFGLRFDFDYFVFRADMGLPLRNPYPSNTKQNKGFWVPNRISKLQFNDLNPNIAVGYPF